MAETTVTLESTLSALIEGKKYAALRDILVTMNPADKSCFHGKLSKIIITPQELLQFYIV